MSSARPHWSRWTIKPTTSCWICRSCSSWIPRGLETLLWLQDQCLENLGQVRLAGCPDNVQTILRITRLQEALIACNDIQTAVESLQA